MGSKPIEEVADRAVLGAAILVSLAGLAILVRLAGATGSAVAVASLTVYGMTLVAAYCGAALYEGRVGGAAMTARFQALDHSTIFLLIAGTYTPFCALALAPVGGWWLLGAVWSIAAIGIWIRVIWLRRAYSWAPAVYLLQGWIGAPWIGAVARTAGSEVLTLMAAGGAAYTLGIGFYLWRSFRFGTVVWHLFVVAGSLCHFVAIIRLLER